MNKKKVAIIFTGGTISMTVDENIGAAIPTLSGEQIMSMVTNIDKVAAIEVFNFFRNTWTSYDTRKINRIKTLY